MLIEVFEAEAEARRQRRITRVRRASRLPPGKTFAALDTGSSRPVAQQLETLTTGAFIETATNALAFGLPGVPKSHAPCAGERRARRGRPRPSACAQAYALVQELLGAKRDPDLPRALRKPDLFDAIPLDDLGYVQQSPRRA